MDEPVWLQEKRKLALSLYEELPTPPPPSRERNFPSFAPAESSQIKIIPEIPRFENGKEILAVSLEQALHTGEEKRIRDSFSEILPAKSNKWIALNQALWRGGAYIFVPGNQDGTPVKIFHPEGEIYAFPRILIIVASNSRISVTDHYGPVGDSPFHGKSRAGDSPRRDYSGVGDSPQRLMAPVVEIVVGENSELHYTQIQELGAETHHYGAVRVEAGRNSQVTLTSAMFGGRRTVNRWQVSLQEEDAQAKIFGLVVGSQEQIFEHYTLQEHLAQHTESDLLLKVALKEKSYSNFDGLIRIEKGAKKTNAYQQNRNLLLSDEGKADSTPRLEILDDDVRCTHGVAIGPVDEEQLFYLESRGISPNDAEALLVEGFFEQLLHRIPLEPIRRELQEKLALRLFPSGSRKEEPADVMG